MSRIDPAANRHQMSFQLIFEMIQKLKMQQAKSTI